MLQRFPLFFAKISAPWSSGGWNPCTVASPCHALIRGMLYETQAGLTQFLNKSLGRLRARILDHDDVVNEFWNALNYGNDLRLDILSGNNHCHPLSFVHSRAPRIRLIRRPGYQCPTG